GMVLARDPAVARHIRQLKGQGQDFERRYWFPIVGYNYRMTNIEAALGLAQLEQIEAALAARAEIEAWYREELAGHPGIAFPARDAGEESVNWLFSVVLTGAAPGDRDAVMARMRAAGVDSRPFFYPCHILPPYLSGPDSRPAECPQAEWLGERGLSLPTWVGLSRQQVRRAAAELLAAVEALAGG